MKPYACPIDGCGKRFNRKHGLAQHLTQHQSGTYDREQLLSAARPGAASEERNKRPTDDDDGEQRQDGEEEDEHNNDEQLPGSGSEDSGDGWQSAARRVHVMAAAVRTQQAFQHVAVNGSDVSYSSNGVPTMSMYASIPLFPVSNGQAMEEDVNGSQQPIEQQHVDEHNGNDHE